MEEDRSRDPNMERVGRYKNPVTEEIIAIVGPELGLYSKVYSSGRIDPLGTTVSEDDIKGLVKLGLEG